MNKLTSIFLLAFFLVGCATDMVNNPDATIKNDRDNGYVAFSTVCSSSKPVYMYYSNYSFNLSRELVGRANISTKLRCDTSQPQYVLLTLPKGTYDFSGFGTDVLPVYNFSGITFSVLPGKVVYLGRFTVDESTAKQYFEKSKHSYLSNYVSDKRKEDVACLLTKYPNISRQSYVINVLH